MKKKAMEIPKFAREAEEADWWASREGRAFLKSVSANQPKSTAARGSRLVGKLNRTASVQIALRLPEPARYCYLRRPRKPLMQLRT